ncbi:saccharopine dehydrogenase C-terminal domain-containing protein [Algoriphagus sediminis]|uniref:Saccharopine dehydrogenase C-terminal domain-containing protein n=1 Tax=Algoriphagus sediminis TaxID=3057113 RepID=A0ABT7YF47_9BACT|nr:saccharopine dehydrogenase C-terminal domain-containing protein [Algoriphagus sediminis]MDN3204945.1 saccharopine dehydrogenase C-terminal domain-containing protein [Algoriphagus sediminis]
MNTILLLGSGKSSTYLIDFLADTAKAKNRKLILADLDLESAQSKLKARPNTVAVKVDLKDENSLEELVDKSSVVISMLPAFLHPVIAKIALKKKKHFFSASYESPEMKEMAEEIKKSNLFFLNECGLDPGIDHMSAMKIINESKENGETLRSFKSFCGGLLTPEFENNPWKYKFTWNPRNVVLAGQGTSRYIEQGRLKFVPYHKLFTRIDLFEFDEIGEYEGYPNRDSLSYRKVYGLEDIPTMRRGTLRRVGFTKAWDVFVQLGLTEDHYEVNLPEDFTLRDFFNTFLPYHPDRTVEEKLGDAFPSLDFPTFEKIQWLGLFSTDPVPMRQGSPAQILQKILEKSWTLNPEDRDMIVMQHKFEIETLNGTKEVVSSLVCKGEDSVHTAMAKTVGLPLALAVDKYLDGEISLTGLHIPVIPEIYHPILDALEKFGIEFKEKVTVTNPG